eukprot:scaffold32298_cov60-Attheya_sp.AAC.3
MRPSSAMGSTCGKKTSRTWRIWLRSIACATSGSSYGRPIPEEKAKGSIVLARCTNAGTV